MAKCFAEINKLLFVFEEELTHCYVAVQAIGDCPIGVQGWHHKVFPKSLSAVDILKPDNFNYLEWSLEAPEDE
jgi:hypothetical protein